jgi:hypothetical protein
LDEDHGITAHFEDRDDMILFKNAQARIECMSLQDGSIKLFSAYPSDLPKNIRAAAAHDQVVYAMSDSGLFIMDSSNWTMLHFLDFVGRRFSLSPTGRQMLAEDRYDSDTLYLLQ